MAINLKALDKGQELVIAVGEQEGTVFIRPIPGNIPYAKKRDELLRSWRSQSVAAFEARCKEGGEEGDRPDTWRSWEDLVRARNDAKHDRHHSAKIEFDQVWEPPQGAKLEIDRQAMPMTVLVGWRAKDFGARGAMTEQDAIVLLRQPEAFEQIADSASGVTARLKSFFGEELKGLVDGPLGGLSSGGLTSPRSGSSGKATKPGTERSSKKPSATKSPGEAN